LMVSLPPLSKTNLALVRTPPSIIKCPPFRSSHNLKNFNWLIKCAAKISLSKIWNKKILDKKNTKARF
jgi:hypothetical protein